MKRSPIQRKTPMKRTVWPLADRATALRRSTLKARVKKPTVAEGSKYLAACRGQDCFLRVFGVCIGRESVVPCHSNQSKHGKAMGKKAKHEFTVPGCAACHRWLDQGKATREEKFGTWDRAYEQWKPVRDVKMGLEINDALSDSHTEGNTLADVSRQEGQELRSGELPADVDVGDERAARRAA